VHVSAFLINCIHRITYNLERTCDRGLFLKHIFPRTKKLRRKRFKIFRSPKRSTSSHTANSAETPDCVYITCCIMSKRESSHVTSINLQQGDLGRNCISGSSSLPQHGFIQLVFSLIL